MDRKTYKALRRCLWATKVSETMDGLYGLRLSQDEEVALDDLFGFEPEIEVEFEEEE